MEMIPNKRRGRWIGHEGVTKIEEMKINNTAVIMAMDG